MADNLRPSERSARNAEAQGNSAGDHLMHALHEVHVAWDQGWGGVGSRANSIAQGTAENTHDALEAARRVPGQVERWTQDRQRDLDNLGRQAANLPVDVAVRARRELRRAGEGVTQDLDARERQLYPEDFRSRDRVVRQPQPAREGSARTAQHTDAAATARQAANAPARPQDANHDYVVRRGDSFWSIVRANEERLHPGVHNRRQESLIVQRLVSRNGGETILPGMHLDLG